MVREAEALEAFASSIFTAMGAAEEVAAEVARHLVLSNLSGHDSHGLLRIPQYVELADSGALVASARPELIAEGPVTALIDAHRGFGHHSCAFALDWCLAKASEMGLAGAAVRHANHIGRLGDYAERAAEAGMVCIVTVGSAGQNTGLVAPFGGTERFLGTNPWAIGVPSSGEPPSGEPPFLFDAATSTIAEGKNKVALAKGAQLAPGLLLDSAGDPTTDPSRLYEGGSLTALGGELGGHKGYGLGLAAALVGGLAMIGDPDPTAAGTMRVTGEWGGRVAGAFLLVIDPARFGGRAEYAALVSGVLGAARDSRPATGVDSVLVPGDPEVRSRAARRTGGIPLPTTTYAQLAAVGERFGVPIP